MSKATKYKHFTKSDRNELSILLKKGYSYSDIGGVIGKDPASISRELARNRVLGQYDPLKAQHKAYARRKYAKYQGMKIRENPQLEKDIQDKLVLGWTPEEIAERLKMENDGQTIIGFKSIYKYLDTPFGEPYKKYLPFKRRKRKKSKKDSKVSIPDRIFIDQRPEIINQRLRWGDFEGDTLGVPRTSKATLAGTVERKSLYFLAKKINRLKETISALKECFGQYQILSLTLDNGPENSHYQELGVPTYFCHSYSAWEKPLIENTFQRLRRYIPKKAKLSDYSEKEISDIIDKMNNTPRKHLNWKTPKEVFFQEQSKQLNSLLIRNLGCCTSG